MAQAKIDFAVIKEAISFQKAIEYLDLEMTKHGEQFRGPCPSCDTDNPRALVITPSKGFYCFGDKRGGDVVGLVAHCKGIGQREAGEMMLNDLMRNSAAPRNRTGNTATASRRATVPSRRPQEPRQAPNQHDAPPGLQPLDYLDPAHEAVEALGITAADAEAIGIGYSPRGLMRGLVAIPVRLPTGELAGYIGMPDDAEIRLPAKWHGLNVVAFPKRRRA